MAPRKDASKGTPVASWVPSRKWFANTIAALGAIGTSTVTTGGWDNAEWLALITLAVGASAAYLIPNG